MIHRLFELLLLCLFLPMTAGWISSSFTFASPKCSKSLLKSSNQDDNNDLKRRMEAVRSLQATFYKSNCTKQSLDSSSGIMYNLPLWRVQWTELPGRTNVLNVHEPIYTNMFESLLHAGPPYYFGHLHLPDGSKNLKNPSHRLQACTEVVGDDDDTKKRSTVLGTLMRVADYRRMADGRLLLLVQALERFAVVDVVQELPYGLAHVQMLPDTEEVEDSDWRTTRTEGDVCAARALAIHESFARWHRYEYENTTLPLPLKSDLPADAVVGSALAKVLPYAPYSSVIDVAQLRQEGLNENDTDKTGNEPRRSADYSQNTLEFRLIQGKILNEPLLEKRLATMASEELEYRIWIALNEYLKATRTPVSPILLGLLPFRRNWPSNFVLERIANAIEEQTELDHKYVRVSPDYPANRRQKRLSYSVAALLEEMDTVNSFRQELLEIPSTRERLAFVLQKLETQWGAFQ